MTDNKNDAAITAALRKEGGPVLEHDRVCLSVVFGNLSIR
jgi:hypothetical protein